MMLILQLILECCFITTFPKKLVNWFKTYGVRNIELNKRMKWHTVIQSIGMVQWYEEQKDLKI